jgi:hypothetical protein
MDAAGPRTNGQASGLGVGTATAERPPTPIARRAAARPVPERSAEFAGLSLEGLREYRKTLTTEEAKVSYWRRIIQARLDTVRAGALGGTDGAYLRPVLTDSRVAGSRNALLEVLPVDDIPPLPSLAELWDRRVDENDAEAMVALEADLDVAEQQLSTYRRALHQRIGAATGELIARYRETPTLCLSALPLRQERRATA